MPLDLSIFDVSATTDYIAVSMTATGAGAGPVIFSLELRTPDQAEGAAGNTIITNAAVGGSSSVEIKLPINSRSFIARARATEDNITYTAWRSVTFTDTTPSPIESTAPQARTVSYQTIRDSVAVALEMDLATGLTTKQSTDLARHISTANRYCVRWNRWEELVNTDSSVTVTNGMVEWTEVQRGTWFEFWSEDPRPSNSRAYRIECKTPPNDKDGIWLDTTASTVFARFIPRVPEFNATALVSGTTYAAGSIRFHTASGQMVQALTSALGSEVGDAAKWTSLPMLAILQDAISLRAQSEYRNMEQQRAQAMDLRKQAEDELQQAAFHASLQNRT